MTPEERSRLRATVDVEALERLLAQLPPATRPLTILAFYEEPTAADARATRRRREAQRDRAGEALG